MSPTVTSRVGWGTHLFNLFKNDGWSVLNNKHKKLINSTKKSKAWLSPKTPVTEQKVIKIQQSLICMNPIHSTEDQYVDFITLTTLEPNLTQPNLTLIWKRKFQDRGYGCCACQREHSDSSGWGCVLICHKQLILPLRITGPNNNKFKFYTKQHSFFFVGHMGKLSISPPSIHPSYQRQQCNGPQQTKPLGSNG